MNMYNMVLQLGESCVFLAYKVSMCDGRNLVFHVINAGACMNTL